MHKCWYIICCRIYEKTDEEVFVKGREKGSKYPMHTNENIAIGLFKEQMIKLILEKNAVIRGQLLFKLQAEMKNIFYLKEICLEKNQKRIFQINTKTIKK